MLASDPIEGLPPGDLFVQLFLFALDRLPLELRCVTTPLCHLAIQPLHALRSASLSPCLN
jgi:hypothetical protein